MRYVRWADILVIPAILFSLAGCGNSSSGGAFNPTSLGTGGSSSGTNGSSSGASGDVGTPAGSGTVLSYKLVLSLTPTSATSGTGNIVGPNSTVVATVVLTDSNGNPVANQPIKFEAMEGPVTIDPTIVTTDSAGQAINFLKAGATTTSAVDVIIKASTTANNQLVTAIGIFNIMRSQSNIIRFLTTKNPTDPDGTLNTLLVTLKDAAPPPDSRQILQLVPFQVLDNNGVPISRKPVAISVYSEIGDCPVFIDSPETTTLTVTTDDAGLGIFNAGVTVAVPPVGSENSCSVIYKAETADPNNAGATIFSYGGFIATLKNVP